MPHYNDASGMQFMAPSANHASMQFMYPSNNIYANHTPASASSNTSQTPDGFNVWCIKGYSGYVNFPKNNDPVETLGRLETMNQVMHNRHDYDTSKLPQPPTPSHHHGEGDEDDISRPPTPWSARENQLITVQRPSLHGGRNAGMDVHCVACPKDKPSGYEVRRIKRLNGTPFCWLCVCNSNIQDALNAWLESE